MWEVLWRQLNERFRPLMRLRKDINELTAADFERCPIWEYALDEEGREGQDECTVRPRPDLGVFQEPWVWAGNSFVRAKFTAADGRVFWGAAAPAKDSDWVSLQPVILSGAKPVRFVIPRFTPDPAVVVREAYEALQTSCDGLFPIQFAATIRVKGVVAQGVIEGFQQSIKDEEDPDAPPTVKFLR